MPSPSLLMSVPVVALTLATACSSSNGAVPAPADAGRDARASLDGGQDAGADGPLPVPEPCMVASMGTSGLLLRGRLLLPTGATTGELLIDGNGMIACADTSCASAAGYAAATRIECPTGVISPALINAHDHTNYATVAPETLPTTRYQHRNDWRTGAEGATPLPHVSSSGSTNVVAAQELRFVLGGATSVVGTGGVPGLLRNLAASDAAQLEGLTGKAAFFDTFPLGDENGTLITSGCAYPSIEAPVAAFGGGQYTPHIAEGINLAAENEVTCTTQMSKDLVTAQTSIIHGVGLNAKDVDVVRKAGAKLIWSPRSNLSLYGNTASVTEYQYAGVTIALGTDWLPSGSMNMLRELACADSLNQKYFNNAFTDQDLWTMATANAAVAAGFDGQIGVLAAGKVADVAVFEGSTNTDFRAVIAAGVEDVHLVLRGGKPLYGDADVVGALQTGCAALSVCGASRSVCFDVPMSSLADAQASAAGIYPLFVCKGTPPMNEPSCVPYRDTYPNGISATDRDGDGIADGSDDCPSVFNPPRPMDSGMQADVDGDGVGDACDAKPLDPTSH